jgi:hypothetical protein
VVQGVASVPCPGGAISLPRVRNCAGGEEAGFMAGGSSRVLALIFSTHSNEFASLTLEWIIRADGKVCYRLARRPLPSVTFRGAPDASLFNPSASAPANLCLPCGPSSIRLRRWAAAVVLI